MRLVWAACRGIHSFCPGETAESFFAKSSKKSLFLRLDSCVESSVLDTSMLPIGNARFRYLSTFELQSLSLNSERVSVSTSRRFRFDDFKFIFEIFAAARAAATFTTVTSERRSITWPRCLRTVRRCAALPGLQTDAI